jgi:hypothetical protein
MVDLLSQYNKIKNEIDQAILNVVTSSAYINGPEVKTFAKELEDYLGAKHVIPCANGTDALQIAMMALDLKPGDEVIYFKTTQGDVKIAVIKGTKMRVIGFLGEDEDEYQWDIIFTDGTIVFNTVYLPKSGIFTFIKNIISSPIFHSNKMLEIFNCFRFL